MVFWKKNYLGDVHCYFYFYYLIQTYKTYQTGVLEMTPLNFPYYINYLVENPISIIILFDFKILLLFKRDENIKVLCSFICTALIY